MSISVVRCSFVKCGGSEVSISVVKCSWVKCEVMFFWFFFLIIVYMIVCFVYFCLIL